MAGSVIFVWGVSNGTAKIGTALTAGVASGTAMVVFTVGIFNDTVVSETGRGGAEMPLAEGAAGVQ